MVRATTGGVMKTYRSNLMNSFINMNNNRNTVLSQRIFNSFAEDPATAARAFRLRKSRMTVESQYSICTDVMKKYETAFSCLQANDDVLCTKEGVYGEYMKTLTGTTLKMLNDPTGDARTQLNKVLDQMSQMLVQTMNQKYGDNFIFAGADGHNVPFEIRDDVLYYRGVPVDATEPDVLKDGDNLIAVDENGNYIDDPETYEGQVYYLKSDSVKVLTKEEYTQFYTVPNVRTSEDLTLVGGATPTEFNKNGLPKAGDDDVGGYYAVEIQVEDDEGNITTEKLLISKADYDAGLPLECNEDGSIRDWSDPEQTGGYYMVQGTDEDGFPTSEPIAIPYYNLIKDNAENAKWLTDADGNEYSTKPDENGSIKFVLVSSDPEMITREEYNRQRLDAEKLKYLANEKYFVDIGFGFQEDDKGNLIESSGFDASLIGLNFLGYGMDEDGDPKNLYSLVQKLREISSSVDEDGDWTTETWEEFDRLVKKFEGGISDYQTQFANLAASTTKLENQQELLYDNFYNLQEQYSDLEDVDMVDAITSFIWAEYCYNAALKVGNSILAESLMDYLR